MMEAEGGVCKWIGGTPKPIYLIDAWTRSTSLTSGANCKLDFFFSCTDFVAMSPLFVISSPLSAEAPLSIQTL